MVLTSEGGISSLTASNIGNNTLYWYESLDATDPLDPDTELEHNKFYYAEFVDEEGCVSNSRTESKAYLSNPVLTATNDIICIDDSTTLNIENVAKTAMKAAFDDAIKRIKASLLHECGEALSLNHKTIGNE